MTSISLCKVKLTLTLHMNNVYITVLTKARTHTFPNHDIGVGRGGGAFYCPKGQKISTLLYPAWFLMVNKSESSHLEFNLATFITPDVF